MAKLHYFNGRGRAELIRLTLTAAKIPFTEDIISEKTEFQQLIKDGKLLFGQVPLLEIDGRQLSQSSAIVRYIGRKAGLMGQTEDETVLIDQLYEGSRDFISPALSIGFLDEQPILTAAKAKTLPKYLPVFEKILASNGTGFLVGNTVSIADLSLLEALLVYVEYLGKEVMNDYPAVQKFFSTLTSLESVSAYMSGPQRKPKNSQVYVNEVRKCLTK